MDVRMPNGAILRNIPEDASRDDVLALYRVVYGEPDWEGAPAPAGSQESHGLGDRFMSGLASLGSQSLTGASAVLGDKDEAAKAGAARSEAIGAKYGHQGTWDNVVQAYDDQGLWEAGKLAVSQIPGIVAESVPQMAESLAGARVGAMAGTAVAPFAPPIAPFLPLAGGVLGAVAPGLVRYIGSGAERTASEQMARGEEVNVDMAKTLPAAAGAAVLDAGGTALALGKPLVKAALGKYAEKVFARTAGAEATAAAEAQLLRTAQRTLPAATARGAVTGGAVELPPEVAQAVLERWQAGLSLTDDSALKEYANSAYGGLGGGLGVGSVGGAFGRYAAQGEVADIQRAKEEKARADAAAAHSAAQQANMPLYGPAPEVVGPVQQTPEEIEAAQRQQQADLVARAEQLRRDDPHTYASTLRNHISGLLYKRKRTDAENAQLAWAQQTLAEVNAEIEARFGQDPTGPAAQSAQVFETETPQLPGMNLRPEEIEALQRQQQEAEMGPVPPMPEAPAEEGPFVPGQHMTRNLYARTRADGTQTRPATNPIPPKLRQDVPEVEQQREGLPEGAQSVLTPEFLRNTLHLDPRSGYFRQLQDLDIRNPDHAPRIGDVVARMRSNPKLAEKSRTALNNLVNHGFFNFAQTPDMFAGESTIGQRGIEGEAPPAFVEAPAQPPKPHIQPVPEAQNADAAPHRTVRRGRDARVEVPGGGRGQSLLPTDAGVPGASGRGRVGPVGPVTGPDTTSVPVRDTALTPQETPRAPQTPEAAMPAVQEEAQPVAPVQPQFTTFDVVPQAAEPAAPPASTTPPVNTPSTKGTGKRARRSADPLDTEPGVQYGETHPDATQWTAPMVGRLAAQDGEALALQDSISRVLRGEDTPEALRGIAASEKGTGDTQTVAAQFLEDYAARGKQEAADVQTARAHNKRAEDFRHRVQPEETRPRNKKQKPQDLDDQQLLEQAAQEYEARKAKQQAHTSALQREKYATMDTDAVAAELAAHQEAGTRPHIALLERAAQVAPAKPKQQAEGTPHTELSQEEMAQQSAELDALVAEWFTRRSSDISTPDEDLHPKHTIASLREELAEWYLDNPSGVVSVIDNLADLSPLERFTATGVIDGERVQGLATQAADGSVRATLVAPHIREGHGRSVMMHEVGTHLGLPDTDVQAAAEHIKGWKDAPEGSKERAVYAAMRKRMKAAEETTAEEMVAYAVEEAVRLGVVPKAVTEAKTRTWADVKSVQDFVDFVAAKFTQRVRDLLHSRTGELTAQDLVDLAYGAARHVMQEGTGVRGKQYNTGEVRFSLSAAAQAELQAHRAMVEALPTGYGAMFRQAYKDKGIVGLVASMLSKGRYSDLQVVLSDPMASVKKKFSALHDLSKGEVGPVQSLLAAQHATAFTAGVIQAGGMEFNAKLNQYAPAKIKDPKTGNEVSLLHVQPLMQQWAKTNNMSYADAINSIDTILQANRLKELQKAGEDISEHMPQARIDTLSQQFANDATLQAIQRVMDVVREHMIDHMVDTGRLSKEQGKAWKEVSGYVNFDRESGLLDRFTPRKRVGHKTTLTGGLPPALVGSATRMPKNVIANHFELIQWMMTTAMKQRATVDTLKAMEQQGWAKSVGTAGHLVDESNRVQTFKDGVETYYKVYDRDDVAAFYASPQTPGTLAQALGSKAAKVLRTGVTAMPTFVMKQLPADIQRAIFMMGIKDAPGFAASATRHFTDMANAIRRGERHANIDRMSEKGIYGELDFNATNPGEHLMQDLLGAPQKGFFGKSKVGKLLKGMEDLARAEDLAIRTAIYEHTMKETGNEALAIHRAREIINFRNRGMGDALGILNFASTTIPFFTTYIQGIDLQVRSLSGKNAPSGLAKANAQRFVWKRAMQVAGIATAMAMLQEDDETYRTMDDAKRDRTWYLGRVGDTALGLPVPEELAVIYKAIPERIWRYFNDKGTTQDRQILAATKSYTRALMAEYVGKTVPIPVIMRGAIESWSNYNFQTGYNVVGKGMQRVAPSDQRNARTTELAIGIAEHARDLMGWELSPIKIDHLMGSYFGTAYGLTGMLTNALINPDRVDTPLHQMVGLAPFTVDPIGNRNKTEFYELLDKASTANSTLNDLMKHNPDRAMTYARDHGAELAAYKILNSTLKYINDNRAFVKFLQSKPGGQQYPDQAERARLIREAQASDAKWTEYVWQLKREMDL